MSNKGKTFAFGKEEQDFIKKYYNTMSKKEIAEKLGVKVSKVVSWARYHEISPKKLRFSDDDIQFMKDNYNNMSYKEIAKKLGYTERQVRGKINNMNLSKNRKFDKHYFDEIDNANKAYWLGFIYADGYVIKNERGRSYELGIELNRADESHLQMFNEELGGVHTIYRKHKDLYIANNPEISHVDTSIIRIYSSDLVNALEKHNVVQNKTNQPDIFPKVENKFFMDFLRGYIDGDGCIYISSIAYKSQVHITSCYPLVLEYIKKILFENYSVRSELYKEKERKYRLYISQKDMMKLLDLLYENPKRTCLKRKYDKYLKLKSLLQ